jgi:DNA primase
MNIIDFMKEHGIRYWTEGKNVTPGWIGIQCMFCRDKSNHLGINLKTFSCKCWICGPKDPIDVIMRIAEVTKHEAILIKNSLRREGGQVWSKKSPPPHHQHTILPPGSTKDFPEIYINHFLSRGMSLKQITSIIERYDLHAAPIYGDYAYRIIIPIYMKNKLVAFTSRAIDGRMEPKYKRCKPEECSIDQRALIYNYDSIEQGGTAIAVEGPADVWSVGDGSFATLGINRTAEQLMMLAKKKLQRICIMFDNDQAGVKASQSFARDVSPLVRTVDQIRLTDIKDPGQLLPHQVEVIKHQIGFYRQ